MALQDVTGAVGRGAEAKKYTTKYDFGANLQESVKMFGEAPVYAGFLSREIVNVQNLIRNAITAGKKPEEIDALVKGHEPGVQVSRKKSKHEKMLADAKTMDDEGLANLLAAAQAEMAKRKK